MQTSKKTLKDQASLSIKKSQGTLNKVLQMMESNQDCADVVQQLDAAIGLLKSSRQKIVHNYLENCVGKNNSDKLEKLKDLYKLNQ